MGVFRSDFNIKRISNIELEVSFLKGPHGLFKRSTSMKYEKQPEKRTFWEHLLKGMDEPIFKRGAYSFGKDNSLEPAYYTTN